ncbi:MAG: Hsp70 family protein [Gemmiger sp.]
MKIGIDLGTTNSLAAYFDGEKPVLVPNRLGEKLTPSVVSMDESGTVYVGRTAQARGALYPDQTAGVFKRAMGTDRDYALSGRHFHAEELSSLVLRSLKEDAEVFLGQPVEEAIISVPAYFNDRQRKATRRAGELAGLKVERIISEPTAAAIAYGLGSSEKRCRFLVFDLGGGTLDVSILERYGSIMEVHAVAGDNFLGGEDFTGVLTQLFLQKTGTDLHSLSGKEVFALRARAENAKLALSGGLMVVMSAVIGGQEISAAVTRAEYETACAPLLQRIRKPIERSLRDARLDPAQIDRIVLVGGASKAPVVRNFVTKLFGRPPETGVNPDEAIALGAALQCGIKNREQALREVVLTDVCPFTLGTTVVAYRGSEEERFSPIIERNTTIPVSRTQRFYTVHDDQSMVTVRILQGESRLPENDLELGRLEVPVPQRPAGQISIDVTYTYDVNALLEVEVLVNATGVKKRVLIRSEDSPLSREQAEARMKELAYLKINPREQEENKLLLFRGEQLYEQATGTVREETGRVLALFERELNSGDTARIERARAQLGAALDALEAMDEGGWQPEEDSDAQE